MLFKLLLALCGLALTVNGQCPEPFIQLGEGCYYFSFEADLSMSWQGARAFCAGLAENSSADLAVLGLLCDDYTHVANFLIMEDIVIDLHNLYVGGNGYDSSWFWIDARPISPNAIYWYEKQPTADPGCVFLMPSQPHTYKKIFYSKSNCETERFFICQAGIHAV